jgi:hypothetical protein
MRACLCFLVVEFMRSGDSVGEACRKGVQRLLKLRPLHSFVPTSSTASAAAAGTCSGGITPGSDSTMHPTLVVGVVAMDKHGNVRALSAANLRCKQDDGISAYAVAYLMTLVFDIPKLASCVRNYLCAQVGGASTLDANNPHRGEPYFPISCWRASATTGSDGYGDGEADVSGEVFTVKASLEGAQNTV